MGPNINVLKEIGFWDHHVALSDQSLCELLQIHDMIIEESHPKFLPHNMVRVKSIHFLWFLYTKISVLWKVFGKQFLIVAKK